MSRSSHQRQQQKLQQQQLLAQQQQIADNEAAAAAAEMFDLFCVATTMRQVLGLHRNICDLVGLRPAPYNEFYPKLKAKIRSWKAQALWKKFDARAAHRVYAKGTAASGTRVLVIGSGPCGLRTAIEAQLLGAKVVVVEKRDRISRNNVLHLWPFVITDLRNLGAKKFYGKFCAGSIDHISIRQLQCILLKVALLLGVEVHEGVSFDRTIEPNGDGCGWRASVSPADHVVSHYEFDVLIGADGKRNTLEGFKRKEFRGKLAIAITANFINKKTEAEAKVEEISGVAFIFNQSFFKELYHTTGIDLENIVYYKDETHYFVMTAKKHSLIDKGVIMQDFADPAELLAPANVNAEKLLDYAREAAEFSTKYQMPNLEFAVNHYGKPDVAMFDFTSMFAAETSCRVIVRKGFRLLQCLVGDSLLEPFWPTGSGCARGFLSSMDAAYAIKLWSNPQNSTLGVLAQRESIYRLLNQTTPENLQRDIGSYTVDPATRYPNLNRTSVNVWQVKHLIDTDDSTILEQTFMDTNALQGTQVDTPVRRKRRSGDSMPLSAVLLRWICSQLHSHEFTKSLKEASDVFTHGKVLCALINRYRPDLVDFNAIKDLSPIECNEIAFKVLEKELNIPRIMSGKEAQNLCDVEAKGWLNYLEQICEVFRGEIPHVKHPKMDFTELREKYGFNANAPPDFSKLLQKSTKQKAKTTTVQDMVDTMPQTSSQQRRTVLEYDENLKRQRKTATEVATGTATGGAQAAQGETPRRAKKRRSVEKTTNIEERQKRLQEIERNRLDRQSKRRQQRYQQTQNFYKSLHMLQANTLLRESDESSPFEDYSIFLYRQQAPEFNDRVKELERKLLFPDRDRNYILSSHRRDATDELFSDRIKSMEQRINSRNQYGTEKKPKDLMRAIGKIDSNDWNVREIEKKMEQSNRTQVHGPKGREKVPKWSKEQFMARQHKMSKPMRQDSGEERFKEIDRTLKNLDKQLKEGSILEVGERGRNKVASIAGQFVKKDDTSDEKNPPTVVQKSSSKVALAFKKQAASEKCHFCKQTVYLMEKINTEGLILHRSCLKCHHCHTNLRPGGYAFDRDDPNGRFYCTQHFRLPAKALPPVVRKPGQRRPPHQQPKVSVAAGENVAHADDATSTSTGADGDLKTSDKLRVHADSVAQLDLLDRGQTPERIEFENTDAMSDGEPSEEHIIDENEWSGRNFLPESNKDSESDLSSSEDSDSDMFEEANDSPLAAQTLQLATDWIGKQNYSDSDDFDDSYDSSDGIADDGKDDTEGEEFKKAREQRREEVRLLPLPANLPTDTETEVQSDTDSSSSDKVERNSATEISTDSEFDHDEIIRETPKIYIDDTHLRKPTRVQVKSTIIAPAMSQKYHMATSTPFSKVGSGSYLQKYMSTTDEPLQPQFKPLVQVDPSVLGTNRMPLQNPRKGDYLLNKTASTEGIASKKSLELKKRYLLGEQASGNKMQKSGSTSVLDSKIRSFHSNISECQKLLNPSSDKSSATKIFFDHSKLCKNTFSDTSNVTRSGNILNDLRAEITIQKASATASTDNEKENQFVNSKNELNKGMEYSETVNTTLVESLSKKSLVTPSSNQTIIETIDLVTPEKQTPIIDLTQIEIPPKMLESNVEFIKNIDAVESKHGTSAESCSQLLNTDSNKIIDLTCDSPAKSEKTVFEALAPDISKDVKERIPDIIEHIEGCDDGKSVGNSKNISPPSGDEHHRLLSNSYNEEKKDSPEKSGEHDFESHDLQIQVPNIPWNIRKPDNSSSNCSSSCSSNTSSIEDIQHFILESTTSPETQTAGGLGTHQVPRLEVHDTAGELMQIDSLMIVDSRYVGDPEDLKLDIPEGLIIAELPAIRTSEVEDEPDVEPDTATPEPMERTVIEAEKTPPVPDPKPAKVKPADLKFDTRNENKVETLKHLPLIVEQTAARSSKVVKPSTLNLMNTQKPAKTHPPPDSSALLSPQIDNDKTPTAELLSRGSDSETEATGTAPVLTETELSDWTADDCISENFVDIEFVLNSNRNTIKRSKKSGRKMVTKEQSMSKESSTDCPKLAPVADFEGILRNLDIDEIEFMDTGSEGSCAETYSATNTALLQNRGFVEFIESTPKNTLYHKPNEKTQKLQELDKVDQYHTNVTKLDEVLGVDYIEQGAYIMRNSDGQQDLLKTPVNEHSLASSNEYKPSRSQLPSAPSQTMTDSSTLNDIDDDSVGLVTNSGVNTKTTTDESEALTVVTSPLDDSSSLRISVAKGIFSTPSSSDKNPKTSTLSACSPTSVSTVLSSNAASIRLSGAEEKPSVVKSEQGSVQRYNADEISCEDYVRALQQKITQISNARDSLDMRKQRRRSSKGETPLANFSSDTQTVIESARIAASESNGSQSWEGPARLEAGAVLHEETTNLACTSTSLVQPHKLPEILTLTSRLEEITKERTKQKDLIHDLVMNKLQSKKQLNAEKRLHRSRQRCLLTSCANGSSLSPTPKLAAATTTTDTNCTSQAHYHVSTSAVASPKERLPVKESSSSSSFKENQPLQKSSTYVAAYSSDAAMSPVRMATYKQRPFSEHLDVEQLDALERYKLTKTPSFSYAMSSSRRELNNQQLSKEDKKPVFPKPLAPFRANHMHTPVGVGGTLSVPVSPTHKVGDDLSPDVTVASTDKLRTEARARARLKSNSELGLSPEEKMQLLRKRLNLGNVTPTERPNCVKSADRNIHARSARDHKMSSSKSVSDLVTIMGQHFGCKIVADENFNTTQSADFVSDPNLLQSSSTSAAVKISKDEKSNRRQKDPERRKSLIQSLSNFFHMGTGGGSGNGYKDSVTSPTGGNSAQTERPGISGSGTTSSSIDGGVFSRFRIASRSKEKSKSCFDIRSFEFAEKDAGLAVVETNKSATTTAASTTRAQYERSNSQDCLINTRPASNRKSKSNSISNCFSNSISNTKHIIHNRNSHHSNNNKHLESSATAKHSTSSPQLFVSSSRALATSDEQIPPPIPPLPLNYQRSDDESYATESREQKKQRSISKAMRQAELKRLRIAQEIQREQEEIEVQLKELEARGVLIEKALRGEGQHVDSSLEASAMVGATDEKLLKELLEIWRNITQLKKRDEELGIRQQELQLEHRHAQLKEELNIRLSSSKLDKSSADVAAEGAILNEMLEIVAKRASLRPTVTSPSAAGKESISKHTDMESGAVAVRTTAVIGSASFRTDSVDSVKLHANLGQSLEDNESHI